MYTPNSIHAPTHQTVCIWTHPHLFRLSHRKIFSEGPELIPGCALVISPAITSHLLYLHSLPTPFNSSWTNVKFKIKQKTKNQKTSQSFSFGPFLAFFPRETDNLILEPCPGKLLRCQTTESTARAWQFLGLHWGGRRFTGTEVPSFLSPTSCPSFLPLTFSQYLSRPRHSSGVWSSALKMFSHTLEIRSVGEGRTEDRQGAEGRGYVMRWGRSRPEGASESPPGGDP